MDAIMFCYLISLVVFEKLNMYLMDVVTMYLYGDLDKEIYMKVSEGFKLIDPNSSRPLNTISIRLRCSLYGLKQFGQMWYNCLSEYLISHEYENSELCACVFNKKSQSRFVIIVVYVDDMNLIGTLENAWENCNSLESELEMKDLGKFEFCLDLKLKHCVDGILINQSNYIQRYWNALLRIKWSLSIITMAFVL